MLNLVKAIFGTQQGRILKKYQKTVELINRLEEKLQPLSDEAIQQKTAEFKERWKQGESLTDLLPEAYAVVKNTCRRLCGTEVHVSGYSQKWDMVPYDVQILGAIALYHGAIAEMQTGEGKTLTAALPLYLNAITGQPVHLVTVNDYLVQRDSDWVGAIFRFLGLQVEALTNATPHHKRKQVYAADIVYGTASEFGFDYLRDNSMAQHKLEQCQRGHYFAIVDEGDSILIDEARTPLIISGPAAGSKQMYDLLQQPVAELVRVQRDLCNRLATEGKKELELLSLLEEGESLKKLDKEGEAKRDAACRKLWLVSKGFPRQKILKRIQENPDLRALIDKWDVYFYGEVNKIERAEALSELYIVVDEKSSEYELTDKGIHLWGEKGNSIDDFVMIDLGYEYHLIDQNDAWNSEEKIDRKTALQEEDRKRKERSHNLRQLLRAHLLMEKDVDYIVSEGKIVIIDENTGRPQPGRRFSDGLHQAIEAKESVAIQGETQTYATITLQNYFRMYEKLAGMTGTALTEAAEFKEIYKLDALAIPTHRPCLRHDFDDEIYMTEREKYQALLKEILQVHAAGRPILIGTESVEISEKLSRILKQNKLEHTVLNAKNHAKEAEIIAHAGSRGAITVATNMAGRGTDIKLESGVAELGGLHVIGTTRHQSRRIDRQLRGRSARQGDPGSSKFYVSFEDHLLRLFTSPKITAFLQRFRPPEGEAISAKVLNKSIETAQKRVEQRNYQIRKHTLEYDDVMNRQRKEVYAFRKDLLYVEEPYLLVEEVIYDTVEQMVHFYEGQGSLGRAGLQKWLLEYIPASFEEMEMESDSSWDSLKKEAIKVVVNTFRMKMDHEEAQIQAFQSAREEESAPLTPKEILSEIIRTVLIRTVDSLWQEHLLAIDHLRTEVHLRAVGQKDPLLEFKHEAFELFHALTLRMKVEMIQGLFKIQMTRPKREEISLEERGTSDGEGFKMSLSLMPEIG